MKALTRSEWAELRAKKRPPVEMDLGAYAVWLRPVDAQIRAELIAAGYSDSVVRATMSGTYEGHCEAVKSSGGEVDWRESAGDRRKKGNMATMKTTCWDETYEVEWTGSVWRRDDTGERGENPRELLRGMLSDSALASGDDPTDPEIALAIDDAVARAEDPIWTRGR